MTKTSIFQTSGDTKEGTESVNGKKNGKSELERLMEEEMAKKKEKNSRKDYWIHSGIVVKVLAKELKDYYKRKGTKYRN